jgi:hypothetical protein
MDVDEDCEPLAQGAQSVKEPQGRTPPHEVDRRQTASCGRRGDTDGSRRQGDAARRRWPTPHSVRTEVCTAPGLVTWRRWVKPARKRPIDTTPAVSLSSTSRVGIVMQCDRSSAREPRCWQQDGVDNSGNSPLSCSELMVVVVTTMDTDHQATEAAWHPATNLHGDTTSGLEG